VDDSEEVEEDDSEELKENVEYLGDMLKDVVKVVKGHNANSWVLEVATDTSITNSSIASVTRTVGIVPCAGHPNFVPNDKAENQKRGISVVVKFGSEGLRSSFTTNILKHFSMSYMSYLEQYNGLDKTSATFAADKAGFRNAVLHLMRTHILSSDKLTEDILDFINADHESIVVTEYDVCLDSDKDTDATKMFNENVALALQDRNILESGRVAELTNDVYDKTIALSDNSMTKGRFLIQVNNTFFELSKAKAISYIYSMLYGKSVRRNKSEEKLRSRAEMASRKIPKDQTHLEFSNEKLRIIYAGNDDGKEMIDEEMDEANPSKVPGYVGDSTMDENGNIMSEEATKFLVNRCKFVFGNGCGPSVKHLAYRVQDIDRDGKLQAFLGGANSKLGENHGIDRITEDPDIIHLNYGLYGSNIDAERDGDYWHILYYTLLPNLPDLLRKKKLFLFASGKASNNIKKAINEKLGGEFEGQDVWLSWDPRIRHTRVSTKTGKIKVFYTLSREN